MTDLHPALDQLRGVFGNLTEDQARMLAKVIGEQARESVLEAIPSAIEAALNESLPDLAEETGVTPEVAGVVRRLAAQSDDSREGVLRKALNLYGAAIEAVQRGNRLAILNPEDEIVRDIVGFPAAGSGVLAEVR